MTSLFCPSLEFTASSTKASLITPPKMSRCLPSAFSMHLSRLLQPAFAQQLLLPTDDEMIEG